MAGSTDMVAAAIAGSSGTATLAEVRRTRDGRTAQLKCTPADDPAGAFRQRVRITRVSEPRLLERLANDLSNGAVTLTLTADGPTRQATMQAIGKDTIRLTVDDSDVLIATFAADDEEEDEPPIASAMGVAVAIVLIVLIVAAVGAVIVIVGALEGDCEVEAEADERDPKAS
jgi:hypothetical protein